MRGRLRIRPAAWSIRAHAIFVGIADVLVGTTLAVIVVLTTVQVVARYVFNIGLPWVNEAARFLFIWLVMLGAGAASARGEHVGFDMVLHRLHGAARIMAEICLAIAALIFLGSLIWEGYRLAVLNSGQRSPVLGLPMSIVYLGVPVGGVLCLIGLGLKAAAGIRGPGGMEP